MRTALPGPEAQKLARRIARSEAPGIGTLIGPPPGSTKMVWRAALGSNVLDVDGNRYLDLTSGFGVATIGHRHPRVAAAVREQQEILVHGLGDVFSHPSRIRLAERLAALAPMPDARVYFAVSGSDAVEIALKTARLETGREAVLAFDPGYHGLTLGSLRVTSRATFREPFVSDPPGSSAASVLRRPFGASLVGLEEFLRRHRVGAVVVEPIVGREGVVLPPTGWLAELSRACRRAGSLLIADEIFVGFGRVGPWFVSPDEGARPDLVCCGKALGGGLPIAAVLATSELFDVWSVDGEALHTATFVAHPLACAAALATLDVLEEWVPGRAGWIAERLGPLLERAESSGFTVRGRGALWGLEGERAGELQGELLERGLLTLAGGPRGDVLQLAPPLSIDDEQLKAVVDLGADALAAL